MKDPSCRISRWQLLKAQLNNLTPPLFVKAVQQGEAKHILIDVRTAKEFALGHLPTAVNIDYLAIDFWEKIELLPRDLVCYIYCQSGRRSTRACTLMRNGGFASDQLYNLDGGLRDWEASHPKLLKEVLARG